MTYYQEGKSRKPVERRESSRLQSAAKLLRSKKNIELSQSKKKRKKKVGPLLVIAQAIFYLHSTTRSEQEQRPSERQQQ